MLDFIRQFGQNRQEVGSLFPSSQFLADALIWRLKKHQGNKAILEVGPGTGAVTNRIIMNLVPGDELWLVEANPRFCEILEEKRQTVWKQSLTGVTVHIKRCYLEHLKEGLSFDYIVSGLPLNNFEPPVVQSILQSYMRLLKPKGYLSYFEYLGVRKLRSLVTRLIGSTTGTQVNQILEGFIKERQIDTKIVFLNIPPAVARHFQLHNEA
ncbi:MAG: methyltransferase domain-containing protein [Candidatus Cloacimonetes bacterium]|nr:methyltransferase domain-containing protein [Candidatus Cloacimonadota bacterium]